MVSVRGRPAGSDEQKATAKVDARRKKRGAKLTPGANNGERRGEAEEMGETFCHKEKKIAENL